MWNKRGIKVDSTIIQILDNHVLKYVEPAEANLEMPDKIRWKNKFGINYVGALTLDRFENYSQLSRRYSEIGLKPKRIVRKFLVEPKYSLPPTYEITARHFKIGEYVDVLSKTIDYGFQVICQNVIKNKAKKLNSLMKAYQAFLLKF